MGRRRIGTFVVSFAATLIAAGTLVAVTLVRPSSSSGGTTSAQATQARQWTTADLAGNVKVTGEVPLAVLHGSASYLRPVPKNFRMTLNFGYPITDTAALNRLIVQEATTHRYISRAELYTRYSPPAAQVQALASWLKARGFQVTHVGADRLELGVAGSAGLIERTLHVQINEYMHPAGTMLGVKVAPYVFVANANDPTVPARFGLQTVSGLSSVDRFFTDGQLAQAHESGTAASSHASATAASSHASRTAASSHASRTAAGAHASRTTATHSDSPAIPSAGGGVSPAVRSGGYWPSDIRSLYDVTPHNNSSGQQYNGQGETLGFTLWGAGETQPAMTAFANTTGDQAITVDKNCVATGTPTTPSSCTTLQVAADHLVTILENGNLNNNWAGNAETGLDIEQAHGIATHAGMKYYDADCSTAPPVGSGLANASCNGSDVGLEDAIEDAANDPTLHTISNSWGYGGDPEWGTADPFAVAAENSFAIAAAAGTTFYFSTGDSGTYESGFPADSPYVVAVGGTTLFSTSNPAQLSTEDTWADGGAWCSNIYARPAWQTGAAVTARAGCSGRVVPDVSAVADTNSAVFEAYSNPASTSLLAPAGVGATNITTASVTSMTVGGTLLIDTGANQETDTIAAIGETATTLSAAASAGATNIKVGSTNAIAVGDTLTINAGATNVENATVQAVGSSGASGSGITLTAGLQFNHASGAAVLDQGTGITLSNPLTLSHSNGASVYVAVARTGSVGGTSVAGPEWNGLTATVENFVAQQTYPGKTPAIGFTGPIIYTLGNSNQNAYYRDVVCGDPASPSGSPDGEAAQVGWDAATGWGAPDWFHFATGYAMQLGATGLTTPSSTSPGYSWSCAKTPSNTSERSLSFPSSSVGYSVGATGTSWITEEAISSSAWGTDNTFFQTSNGGQTWVPSNSDMFSVACTSTSSCVEVGDGGIIKTTSNSGATWSAVPDQFNKALTQVTCPSSSVCYAAGDRGFVLKSTNGGQSWTQLSSTDGNPIYGLYCASTTICYATDIYAHIIKTTDGGNTWTWQTTPVTTPGVDVPGSGGPNPFAGLFGVACVDAAGQDCVAVGGYPPTGSTAPIVSTTNGGSTWVSDNVTAPANDWLTGVSCLANTTTCYAVGRGGLIETTTDMVNWTQMTSGTTNVLNGITCQSTTSCIATGQGGTIDVLSGSTWTPTTGNANSAFLAGIACPAASSCYAVGKQGVTIATTNGTTWSQQAGGGSTTTANGISCPSTSNCTAVGNTGTIYNTTNSGQTWLAQTSGTTQTLSGVSCTSTSNCVAAGGANTVAYTTNGGTSWSDVTAGATNITLDSVSCSGANCTAVGTLGTIEGSSNGGQSWSAQSSGTTATLDSVTCPTASTCFASGAVANGSAVIDATTNGGASWTLQSSNAGQALNGITCLDASNCFAGGAIGTLVSTNNGGASWTQQGDPLSGPVTVGGGVSGLNVSTSTITAINGMACSSTQCSAGTGSSGDIMTSPLLSVTINAVQTAPYQINNITGVPSNSAYITYSPTGVPVTGALSCSTTATPTSPVGTYPISNCSGLAASGYSVVYNYAASTYQVAFPTVQPIPGGNVPSTLSLSLGSTAPSLGAFTPGQTQTYNTSVGATATSTASTATLSAADTSTTCPGYLVNSAASGGPYCLNQPGSGQGLMVNAIESQGMSTGGGVFQNLASTNPATLLTFTAPVSNDPVTIGFQQTVASTTPLRTGTYTKTITFTLSTSTP